MSADYSLDKGLPAAPEVEKDLLGSLLIDPSLIDEVASVLKAEHFFLDAHRRIYQRIADLYETSRPIETVTLMQELQKHKELSAVGGAGYLASLTDGVPRRSSVSHYVEIIVDKFTLRSMIHAANSIVAQALDPAASASQVVGDAEAVILGVAAAEDSGAVKIGDVTSTVEQRVAWGMKASTERTAVELTWGLGDLDRLTRGAFGGELTVVGGESGGCKTSFGVQMTLENVKEGSPVAWFSMEMSRDKLTQRFYPQLSNIITAEIMRDPRLMNDHTHVPEIQRISEELATLPIWIDDSSALPINKVCARIRMMRRKHGIRLFVIDYLQLITMSQAKSKAEGIEATMFALRDLVKTEPTIHILLLSQYSKADGFSKKRTRSRSDLYGSSTIHHAAQNVLLLALEDATDKDSGFRLDCEIKVDKQRDGKKGKVECLFDPDFLRFKDKRKQMPLTGEK